METELEDCLCVTCTTGRRSKHSNGQLTLSLGTPTTRHLDGRRGKRAGLVSARVSTPSASPSGRGMVRWMARTWAACRASTPLASVAGASDEADVDLCMRRRVGATNVAGWAGFGTRLRERVSSRRTRRAVKANIATVQPRLPPAAKRSRLRAVSSLTSRHIPSDFGPAGGRHRFPAGGAGQTYRR